MKKASIIAVIVILLIVGFLAFQKPRGFKGIDSPTLHNTTSTLIASSALCGTTSSVALGPISGTTYLRVTNNSTGSIYIAPVNTSSGFVTVNTGILMAPASNGGMYYWDSGEANINLEGSYIACVATASGSQISYFQGR